MIQAQLDAAKVAQQRASSSAVKDYTVRAVAEQQAALDAISDMVKAKRIDLDASTIQNDPLLKAQRDTEKDALDRLRNLSGTAFDAAFMTAQRPVQALLSHTAQEGLQVTRDTEVANVLRMVAGQARDRASKAVSILPTMCGGERPGWG
jgi:predicted outer membrane protein